jgi:hypothetical protein
MGFSDNLENDLKNLERAAERDPAAIARQQAAREAERTAALAVAPHAEQLRKSQFTADLLNHASVVGRGLRLKINILWTGPKLRLQARDHYLELRPTATGVQAHLLHRDSEIESFPVDFSSNAEDLARQWLARVVPPPNS